MKQVIVRILSLIILSSLSFAGHSCLASVGNRVLGFKMWKEIQVVEAQNRVVRLSNKIQMIAKDGETSNDSTLIEDQRSLLRESLDSLNYSKSLTFSDYVEVYLSQFEGRDLVLEKIAEKLSEEERVELLKYILKVRRATAPFSGAKLMGTESLSRSLMKRDPSI